MDKPEAPRPHGEVTIGREDTESKGRYVARVPGAVEEAELTFSKAGTELLIADHTAVPDAMRGMGVGAKLAARLVEDARRGAAGTRSSRCAPSCVHSGNAIRNGPTSSRSDAVSAPLI